jgi:DNA-binding NarL/FixJ family response regulator
VPALIRETCRELKEQWRAPQFDGRQAGTQPIRSVDHPIMPELRGHMFLQEVKCASGRRAVFLLEFEHRIERETVEKRKAALISLARLAPKERELVDFVREGAGNAEIARRLQLSVGTVKSQLSAVFQKLSVPGRSKLMALMR